MTLGELRDKARAESLLALRIILGCGLRGPLPRARRAKPYPVWN